MGSYPIVDEGTDITQVKAQPEVVDAKVQSARRGVWVFVLVGVWGLIVFAGMGALWRYSLLPGRTASAKATVPTDDQLPRIAGRATLIMAVHPLCPCSQASMSELGVLLAKCDSKLTTYVLFAETPGLTENLETTELWKSASRIPGLKLVRDQKGTLARRLGAQTSGQVFLYDADGILQFSGGITTARGHAGANDGRTAIEAILHDSTPETRTTSVFGCELW